MTSAKNKRGFVNLILQIIGFSLCILPPTLCTLTYFPLWREAGDGKILSGGVLLLLLLSAYPVIRALKIRLKSPSLPIIWLAIFLGFFILSRIAREVTIIAFYGFVGNLLGAICFNIAKRCRGVSDFRGEI